MDNTENYWPESREDLINKIDTLVNKDHDYETAADAMWRAALLTFNYIAKELGTTGFQASHAGLMFFAKSRNLEGPFAVIKAEDMLYPQYDIHARVEEYLEGWQDWASEQAKLKLEEEKSSSYSASDRVVAHWKELAKD